MKMILVPAMLVTLMGIAGCAAVVKPMPTPDGKDGFSVSCDGSADDWTTCYKAATEACKGKYSIIDKQLTSTPTGYGPMVRRNLIVECQKQ